MNNQRDREEAEAREAIVAAGRRLWERGYVAANDGNLSVRLPGDRILMTPSGVSKGAMKPEDLVVVDREGRILEGGKRPSSEILLHLAVFRKRPDIRGVCHAHPPCATGFAVAGIPLDQAILPEVILSLGTVPLAEYGTPGTPELVEPVLPLLEKWDAFLLANHGAVALGRGIDEACYKMEIVEHFAKIVFVSQMLGKIRFLTPDQVSRLIALREGFGIRPDVGGIPEAADPAGDCIASTGSDTVSGLDRDE